MGYVLGVDLGTTFTAAAVRRDGSAQIASLGSRGAAIPSVVLLRDDETVLTGEAAERRAMTEPERVAREFKRRLGDSTPILLAGTPYSAEALMSRLLRWVVDEVSTREGGPPDAITVTHPANWGAYKIDLLNQAIRIADVGAPITLLTEPVAAAISYASQQRLEVGEALAVFDLGGGTFDAAVLRRTETGFEILGEPEGIERLGGIDFDAAVYAHVSRTISESLQELDENDSAAQNAVARLRADCIEAKEALSADTDASIPVLLPNLQTEVRLTRAEFEAMIRPSLVDAIEALRRALRSANVEPADVSAVLLVGGSSRIPLVAQLVGAEFGRPVAVDAHPKHAIAIGAAIAAAAQARGGEPVSPEPEPAAAAVSAAPTEDGPPPADPPQEPPPSASDDLPTPPVEPPVAPGSAGPGDGGGRRRKLVFAGVALLLVAVLAGVALALSGDDPDTETADPGGSSIPDDVSSTTAAPGDTTTTSTTTTTTTTTTIPPDEDCAAAMELALWVCLESVRLESGSVLVTYSGEFGGETLVNGAGMHLHVFGDDVAAADAGNQSETPDGWQVIDTPDEFEITLDNHILADDPEKICARVADARPDLTPSGRPHSLYDVDNGNCLPIPAG